jgi:ornithine carbamoyltransferase
MKFIMATPETYQFDSSYLAEVRTAFPNLDLDVTTNPAEAVRGATAVYTDVWASMGQESESTKRRRDFARYQVNAELMKAAGDAYFMHCLPAHRGEEVTDDVIDGPKSIVVQQASNRLHVQKGILAWMLASKK